MRWLEFLKRIRCLLACCYSQIIVEHSQLEGKPPENEQGATEQLKKLYYDLKNPAAYAGESKLLQEAKKHDLSISIKDVEEWLRSQLAYILHNPISLNFKARPVMVHQIDEQWQIYLVGMSKISKQNDGFKFIIVVIDDLSKYAWLEQLKSKHGIAIKNTLRHPKVTQTDKRAELFNVLATVKTCNT